MKCTNCDKETNNPKFCSRSCSASYNNKVSPKKKRTRKCEALDCDNLSKSYRHKFCEHHHEKYIQYEKYEKYKKRTIGFYRERASFNGKHPAWANVRVRIFCRKWNEHLTRLPCYFCGYDKHVELCHIKPVSSFPHNTPLSVVNSEENVVQLCRNCHWEFDNGLLTL